MELKNVADNKCSREGAIMNLEDVSIKELREKALEIRKELIDLSVIQNIHIGGDLSITDIMTVLWQYQLKYNPKEPNWEGRDRFVLSKGHSSAAMALNQAKRGCFKKEEVMNEYAMDEGRFSMHPCKLINPYVEISTGSLGHGMPIACGIAAALRLKSNMTSRVYTIMGDGEQSEGSVWEAALSAVKYRLGNLISIIDNNEIEGDGFINDITGLGDIACKYRSFGWNVIELNGNDMAEIKEAFGKLPSPDSDLPTVMICHTIKGCGIPYMENQVKWHTGKLTLEQAVEAKAFLDKNYMEGGCSK